MEAATFDDVLGKCLEGDATDAEQRQLLEAARSSGEFAEKLRSAAILDASLRSLRHGEDAFFQAVQARLTHRGGSAKFSSQMRQRIERSSRQRSRPLRPSFIAVPLAALLVLGIGLGWHSQRQQAAETAAALASVVAVRGEATATIRGQIIPATVGLGLAGGDALRCGDDGNISLGYADGSRIDTARVSSLALLAAPAGKHIRIESGSLTAEVAKQDHASPMLLQTPLAEATVVGTHFGLSHGRRGSLLQVLNGTVGYRRLSDGATLAVGAGQNALAADDQPFVIRPNRVTAGLKVMYLFDEMAGTTVHDVSGVGRSMDLTIGDPARARWTSAGLNDGGGGAGIRFSGRADKLIDAFKRSRSLTLEWWCTVRGATAADHVTHVKLSNSTFVSISYMNPSDRGPGLGYAALVFSEKDGELMLTSYDGTPQVATTDLGDAASRYDMLAHENILNIEVSPDAQPPGQTLTVEFHAFAIYGRALSAEEVHQNLLAGVPAAPPLQPIDE